MLQQFKKIPCKNCDRVYIREKYFRKTTLKKSKRASQRFGQYHKNVGSFTKLCHLFLGRQSQSILVRLFCAPSPAAPGSCASPSQLSLNSTESLSSQHPRSIFLASSRGCRRACQRRCYEDASRIDTTRKLLPWNLSFTPLKTRTPSIFNKSAMTDSVIMIPADSKGRQHGSERATVWIETR